MPELEDRPRRDVPNSDRRRCVDCRGVGVKAKGAHQWIEDTHLVAWEEIDRGTVGGKTDGDLFVDPRVLSFRATEKSSLAWTYRNIARIYSSDQLLDTYGNTLGTEYSRTFGPHVVVSTGYEFGIFSFSDGLPPEVSTAFLDFCVINPVDPNCVTYSELLAQPPAEDQGFDRHRAYAGFGYDIPAGLHLAIDGGYDLLVYSQSGLGSVSRPFARASAGWNGARLYTRVGYEQGLDEGGGILTNAELGRGQANMRVLFTDNASLDLSVSRDVRQSLDIDGGSTGITLTTLRGGTSFTYKLPRGWALIASYTQDRQTARGTSAVPAASRANRCAMGASWSFGRRTTGPADPSGAITRQPHGG